MAAQPFPSVKDPLETRVLTFDDTADLASGETLTSILSTTITAVRGTDPNPSAIITSAAINTQAVTVGAILIAVGMCVQAICTGGLDGCWYEIRIQCATSNPDKIVTLKAILQVSAS